MNRLISVEKVLKSPLTSILKMQSEEMLNYVQEMDDFFIKEWYLLNEQICDLNQCILYLYNVIDELKIDVSDRKLLVLKSSKEMIFTKINDLIDQEQMILSGLKKEEKRLSKEIQNSLQNYDIY